MALPGRRRLRPASDQLPHRRPLGDGRDVPQRPQRRSTRRDDRAPACGATRITLEYPSHTATDNLLMAACSPRAARSSTTPRASPRSRTSAQQLIAMGARIEGLGTSRLTIDGVEELSPATPRGRRRPRRRRDLPGLGAHHRRRGARRRRAPRTHGDAAAQARGHGRRGRRAPAPGSAAKARARLSACDVATLPYPGVATDYKPLLTTMLSVADGRLGRHREPLRRGGSATSTSSCAWARSITTEGHHAMIRGVEHLTGTSVRASDIRAAAALILAGLVADGRDDGHRARAHGPRLRRLRRAHFVTSARDIERSVIARDPDELLSEARDGFARRLARLLTYVESGGRQQLRDRGAGLRDRRALRRGRHRAPGRGQVDAHRPTDHRGARARAVRRRPRPRPGRRAVRRPELALHRRRDPRRPDPHAGPRDQRARVHPLHGDARAPRRALLRRARRRARARRGGVSAGARRDRRGRPDGGRDRLGRRHDRSSSSTRAGATPCRPTRPASSRSPTSSSSTRPTGRASTRPVATSSRCSTSAGTTSGARRSSRRSRPTSGGVEALWDAVDRTSHVRRRGPLDGPPASPHAPRARQGARGDGAVHRSSPSRDGEAYEEQIDALLAGDDRPLPRGAVAVG